MYTNINTTPPSQVPHTQSAFNTAVAKAQASADPRFNMKEYDRAGVSRSRGTQAQAGIKAAQSLADGIADAYAIPATDAAANANNMLQYQQGMENYGLGAGSIAMQDQYSAALNALQRQQAAMQFQGGALGGLLGAVGKAGGGVGGWLDNFLGY